MVLVNTNVYMSFNIVMIVTQICTVEALQNVKRYIVREDTMLCCFDAQCNVVWAARACNVIAKSVDGEPSMPETAPS